MIENGIVEIIEGEMNNRIWVRVNDVYVCGVYTPIVKTSQERKRKNDTGERKAAKFWREITDEIMRYRSKGKNVILMGDMNARLGEVVGDTMTNDNGRKLKEVSEMYDMMILNKEWGYKKWTRIEKEEKSIIDYVVINREMRERVVEMKVVERDLGSDHMAIEVQFNSHMIKKKKKRRLTQEERKKYGTYRKEKKKNKHGRDIGKDWK